ncbi:hypothetical protein [Rikenella microfusus]|nr:hypothetical protein [Rikenella microfusus]
MKTKHMQKGKIADNQLFSPSHSLKKRFPIFRETLFYKVSIYSFPQNRTMIFPNGPRYRPVQGSGSFLQEKGPRSKQIEKQAYVSNRGKPYILALATIYDFTQALFRLGAGRHEAVQTRAKDPEGPARAEKIMQRKIVYNYPYLLHSPLR